METSTVLTAGVLRLVLPSQYAARADSPVRLLRWQPDAPAASVP
ncbi:hypothetical protein [Nonomuraea longicatena]